MWKTESPLIAILARLVGVIFNCDVHRSFGVFVLFCTVVMPAFGQTSVLMQHNDNARTGQNTSETILDTTNVNVSQFGKLFAMPSDGQVYAQPLYVPGVTINGGVHNLVVLATENDSVYAYDADSSGAPLWKASMVDAAHGAGAGETALNSATTTGCNEMPQVGITSTPVIDPTSKTIYVEAKSTDGVNYFHRLHALDLLTGNEKTPGPVVIAGTVSGTGDGSSNGQLSFDNLLQLNRPGLLLLNGTIYIAYGSHCDFSPYHGWLFAYDEATFTQKSVYVTTPNGGLGGFWMSGAGVAADASGNIFIASGNGDFDTINVPATETGDTILKFSATNQILTQLDYFTPEDQGSLDTGDIDLGSGGVLLVPDQSGSFPHILVQAGKEGRIYVVNRDQMTTNNSHYCSGCSNDPEIIEESGIPAVGSSGGQGGMFNIAAYWNNTLYFWGVNDVLKSIPITNGLPDFTHVTGSTPQIGFPGAGVSVSSNGMTPGSAIVWAINGTQYGSPGPGPGPAVVYAYDATNILTMLYSSAQNATRDAAGNAAKFAVPTVANGKVYVGTSTEVDVYGLVGTNPLPNISSINPSSATAGGPAFPLTVNGSGFTNGATVNFGSNPVITPSSVTSTQIVATIPAADIATAGTVNVTVTNPAAGGTSNAQTFTINNPAPTETSLSPTSATAGGAAFTLTVNGTGFVSTSVVKFNGAAKTATFVSATQLTAAIAAADIATAGTASVTVTNPAPGGGTSGTLSFTINGSALTLTSIAPASTTAGGAAFTLTLTGTGFATGATVNFGTNPAIIPSSVTGTQIVAAIPAADIATAGTVNVTVTNPAGGGTSNAQTFTINNPAPTETSLSPTSATAGGAAFTLTVNGTGFVSTSVVKFNGAAKPTTFVGATQLTAAITAADIVTAGTATVTVSNPSSGGTSNAASFTINNPAPTVSSLSPSTVVAGSAAFTLTLNGAGFVNGAGVQFNGGSRATTFVSKSQITATILASDIATAGTADVTATNPAPTVGPSAPQAFIISSDNPVPTISNLGAAHAAGGAPFTLAVNGTNFEAKSVVNFNGKPETTTFINATKISATIPASDVAIAGNMNVTVTNPAPGGGTSAVIPFTVDGYTISGPSSASLSPSQPAMIQITAMPTANGFPNSISFSVSGLPAGATASFKPVMLTPNGSATPTTLTITDGTSAVSRRAAAGTVDTNVRDGMPLRLLLLLWIAAIVGWLYLRLQSRAIPIMKRYSALALFALVLLTGSILSGCALGGTHSPSTSTSQLTVTATSGTLTQMFGITLNVKR